MIEKTGRRLATKLTRTVVVAFVAFSCVMAFPMSQSNASVKRLAVASTETVKVGSSDHVVNGVDVYRARNYLVIYTPARGLTTKTSSYGTEASVVDGRVTKISTGTGNTAIPSNGFVLSGRGTSRTWLQTFAQVGSLVARSSGAVSASSPAPLGVPGAWNLTFRDEFNGTALDTSKWLPHFFYGDCDYGSTINNATTCSKNVTVGGGNMTMTMSAAHEGAFVISNAPQVPLGGYTEARVYFPGNATEGVFNWPAWWTVGDPKNWPVGGENDIAEEGGPGDLTASYHGGTSRTAVINKNGVVDVYKGVGWINVFHTYGVWRKSASENVVFWDGQQVASYSSSDSGISHNLVFDIGAANNAHTGTASQVKVDYVRVWK